jgi:hypothetical protein
MSPKAAIKPTIVIKSIKLPGPPITGCFPAGQNPTGFVQWQLTCHPPALLFLGKEKGSEKIKGKKKE